MSDDDSGDSNGGDGSSSPDRPSFDGQEIIGGYSGDDSDSSSESNSEE